jgi:hypothetical protein
MSTFTKVYAALRQGVLPVADDLPNKIVGIQAGDLKTVFDELERLRAENARLQSAAAEKPSPTPPASEASSEVEDPGPLLPLPEDA